MKRKTFDYLVSWIGVILTLAFLGASVGLFIGHSFDSNQIKSQLAREQVYFPTSSELKGMPESISKYLGPYAGQQVVNGREAEVFADHYIAVHLKEIGGGKTYSELSGECLANPNNTTVCAEASKYFQGDTLRGLLLNAYAFWIFGQMALVGAWGLLGLGLVMAFLTALGLRHYQKVDPEVAI